MATAKLETVVETDEALAAEAEINAARAAIDALLALD